MNGRKGRGKGRVPKWRVLRAAGTTGRREGSCLQLGHRGGADMLRSFIGTAGHSRCSERVPMCPSSTQNTAHRGYRTPSTARDHMRSPRAPDPPPCCGLSVSTPDFGSGAGISRQAPSPH